MKGKFLYAVYYAVMWGILFNVLSAPILGLTYLITSGGRLDVLTILSGVGFMFALGAAYGFVAAWILMADGGSR